MKCEFCAGDLGIEDKFCTHCGKPNRYYEAHRADMEAYERRFRATEQRVLIKSRLFERRALFVALIAILASVILAEIIVLINMDEINYSLEKRRNTKKAGKIMEELDGYIEDGDYLSYYSCYECYSNIDIHELDRYYLTLGQVCGNYNGIVNITSKLASGDYKYDTAYNLAGRVNNLLSSNYSEIDDTWHGDEHVPVACAITDEMHGYIATYCEIDPEVVAKFKDIDDSARFTILYEAIEGVMNDENE